MQDLVHTGRGPVVFWGAGVRTQFVRWAQGGLPVSIPAIVRRRRRRRFRSQSNAPASTSNARPAPFLRAHSSIACPSCASMFPIGPVNRDLRGFLRTVEQSRPGMTGSSREPGGPNVPVRSTRPKRLTWRKLCTREFPLLFSVRLPWRSSPLSPPAVQTAAGKERDTETRSRPTNGSFEKIPDRVWRCERTNGSPTCA